MALRYYLNGVDLSRWTAHRGTLYRPPISVRSSLVTTSRHGVTNVGLPVFDEPQVTFHFAPIATHSSQSLDEMVADLTTVLASPSITVRREAVRTEEARARLVSTAPSEMFIEGQYCRMIAALALPGVFFRDPTATDVSVPAGVSSQAGLAGSGPVADAVVRFPAGAPAVKSLTDVTTGTGVSIDWSGSGYLYIDCGTLQAWSSASASQWTPGGTDHSAIVDYPAAGPLQLWPVLSGAARAVTVEASHPVVVRAKRAWL